MNRRVIYLTNIDGSKRKLNPVEQDIWDEHKKRMAQEGVDVDTQSIEEKNERKRYES